MYISSCSEPHYVHTFKEMKVIYLDIPNFGHMSNSNSQTPLDYYRPSMFPHPWPLILSLPCEALPRGSHYNCTEVTLNKQTFWDVTPCRLVWSCRRFGRSQHLNLLCQAVHWSWNLYNGDVGTRILRNVLNYQSTGRHVLEDMNVVACWVSVRLAVSKPYILTHTQKHTYMHIYINTHIHTHRIGSKQRRNKTIFSIFVFYIVTYIYIYIYIYICK
jgi:hypothetical protein